MVTEFTAWYTMKYINIFYKDSQDIVDEGNFVIVSNDLHGNGVHFSHFANAFL